MWYYIIFAFTAMLIEVLISSYKYKIIFANINERISVWKSFLINCIVKFSMHLAPFKMGTILTKPVATKVLSKIRIKKSLPAIFFEQIFDTGWQILMLPFLLLLIGQKRIFGNILMEFAIFAAFIVFIFIAYKKRGLLFSWLFRMKRFLPNKIRKAAKKHGFTRKTLNKMVEDSLRSLSDWRFLAKLAIPTVVSIFTSHLILLFCAYTLSLPVDFVTAFLIYWTSAIIGRLSGLPGGFGAKDATMLGLFTLFGFDIVLAVEVLVLYRILTFVPFAIISGITFFCYGGKFAVRKSI